MHRQNKPTANSIYPKDGVLCSKDRFVVTGTFVLLINICGELPVLRVAVKRCRYLGKILENYKQCKTNRLFKLTLNHKIF